MRKLLMSGECKIGYCGKLTPLYDTNGEQLRTGDLVQLSAYSDEGTLNGFYGVEYICHNEFEDAWRNYDYFVMGIASEHFAYKDGEPTDNLEEADFIETIVKQNHKEWRITKVKDWSETVDGEKWGAVRTVLVD